MRRISLTCVIGLILCAVAFSSALASPLAKKSDPNAWAASDKSGKDCTAKHVIFVSFLVGGMHVGKGRKYMDLQVVGRQYDEERRFYAKTKTKQFVVCSVQRVIFDRYLSGKYVNPAYKTYYPSKPGLSVNGTVPPASNKEVMLIAFGRFKAKH